MKHSVRQGCPLLPLLFIIALDALSSILHNKANLGRIEGVKFDEINEHNIHSFYADDIRLILRVDEAMIHRC